MIDLLVNTLKIAPRPSGLSARARVNVVVDVDVFNFHTFKVTIPLFILYRAPFGLRRMRNVRLEGFVLCQGFEMGFALLSANGFVVISKLFIPDSP